MKVMVNIILSDELKHRIEEVIILTESEIDEL